MDKQKTRNRLNLGCGTDYKKGWINVDFNKEVKADIHCDLNNLIPFKDNSVDRILLDNSLEHIHKDKFFWFMDGLHRICKNKAEIIILVPHFSSCSAFKHLGHQIYFGISSFSIMDVNAPWNEERYNKARFKILKEELRILHRPSKNFEVLNKAVLCLDWFYNLGGRKWKLFWEKFNLYGFEEIVYILEVVK